MKKKQRRNGVTNRNGHKNGFTLVEVIVILVILAVLAAIMIPAMTGWIDKAKQKSAIVGCRTCVVAAQTLASEAYGKNGALADVVQATAGGESKFDYPGVTTDGILALAGLTGRGTVSGVGVDRATAAVNHLTYHDDASGATVTYCRTLKCHAEHYNYSAASAGGSGGGIVSNGVNDLGADFAAVLQKLTKNFSGHIDSSYADGVGARTKEVLAYLRTIGVDLDSMQIKSWTIAGNNGGTSNPAVMWTNQDVSTMAAGDTVPVIWYSTTNKTYQVGEATLEKSNDVIRIKDNKITNAETANDFADALTKFNALS